MCACDSCVADFLQKGKSANTTGKTEQNAILKQLGLVATSCEASSSSKDEKVDNQPETEKREEVDNKPEDPFLPSERPQQKNKKKCWVCKSKLELAQRELGNCKCGKYADLVTCYFMSLSGKRIPWSYNNYIPEVGVIYAWCCTLLV